MVSSLDYESIRRGQAEGEEFSFPRHVAHEITGDYNQHVTLLIVGKTGMGKSMTALSLAEETSEYIADHLGGRPREYFNIQNVAIISMDETMRVLKRMINKDYKHNVFVFDDIGTNWNSRDWQKKGNKILNRIFQTFRVHNNFVILTLPDTHLLDKVPRTMVHWLMEMQYSAFSAGATVSKLFEVVRRPRSGRTLHVYPRWNGSKYIRHVNFLPSDEIVEHYERKREMIHYEQAEDDLSELEEWLEEEKDDKSGDGDRITEMTKFVQAVNVLREEEDYSVVEACEELGRSHTSYYNWRKKLRRKGVSV